MATKVTILGNNEPIRKRKGKKIEFLKCLGMSLKFKDISGIKSTPDKWGNVMLISKNYDGDGTDLMIAFENTEEVDGASNDCLFLGHFNDGIV